MNKRTELIFAGFRRGPCFFYTMNTNMRHLIFLLILVLVAGCLPDREFVQPVAESAVIRNLRPGLLRINEVFPTGVDTASEKVDWIELWNTSDSIVELAANQFLVSDKSNPSSAYASARTYQIPPKGFFVVYFQNGGLDNSTGSLLNPNGSLSSNGEFAGIWFLSSSGDTILVDSLSFPASPNPKKSFGSVPDGSSTRNWLDYMTKGSSNNINNGPGGSPSPGRLVINEVAPNESPDWVELANPFSQDLLMKAGEWFFTDDTTTIKDTLKVDFLFPAHSYKIVQCGTTLSGSTADQLRARFSLSSTNGEDFGIYYKNQSGDLIPIAELSFPAGIQAGTGYGRSPDISGSFISGLTLTPGAPNP